jgi:hypothetical protein
MESPIGRFRSVFSARLPLTEKDEGAQPTAGHDVVDAVPIHIDR